MELIDALKYGAIGLCAILFIVSARLLTKEQNRQNDARQPILNMIKWFLASTVLLAVFFGLLELLKPNKINATIENAITSVWESRYSEHLSDTTLILKARRVKNGANDLLIPVDSSKICEEVIRELEKYKAERSGIEYEFYTYIIKLKKEINDKGGTINVDFNPNNNKKEVYEILEYIFLNLEKTDNQNMSDDEIRAMWKQYKRTWATKNFKFIDYWDVAQIVREYLDKFYPNNAVSDNR